MAKAAPSKPKAKAPSKSEVLLSIATATDLNKKQIAAVFDALAADIKKALSARGPGVYQIPGLLKITKRKVPARPAQKQVLNRLTGKVEDRAARPAYNKVSVRALKNLKSMV